MYEESRLSLVVDIIAKYDLDVMPVVTHDPGKKSDRRNIPQRNTECI